MTTIDDFSLLVCLAAISARSKDQTKQAGSGSGSADAEHEHLFPVKFELEFDSSAALATLHGARQVLRAAFAAKRIDAAHVRSVIDTSRSNLVIALYICGMLALMVAQNAVATRVDRLDALLSEMLGVLAHYAANNDIATPHGQLSAVSSTLFFFFSRAFLLTFHDSFSASHVPPGARHHARDSGHAQRRRSRRVARRDSAGLGAQHQHHDRQPPATGLKGDMVTFSLSRSAATRAASCLTACSRRQSAAARSLRASRQTCASCCPTSEYS
jgi:hypothetical protein